MLDDGTMKNGNEDTAAAGIDESWSGCTNKSLATRLIVTSKRTRFIRKGEVLGNIQILSIECGVMRWGSNIYHGSG